MSQPVKISDEFILDARLPAEMVERSIAGHAELWAQLGREIDARLTADVAERSIAGHAKFWAQFGRAIEPLLEGTRALALRRAGAVVPLSESLASVDSVTGRRRVVDYLESGPFPHYQPAPGSPGLVVRVEADGTRTLGRFVAREFQAVPCP